MASDSDLVNRVSSDGGGGKTQLANHLTRVRAPLDCLKVPGLVFSFGTSFIRQRHAKYIMKLNSIIRKYPSCKLLIFGHTDDIGNVGFNKRLSERRALSIYSFILGKGDIWEKLYQYEGWGLRQIKEAWNGLKSTDRDYLEGIHGGPESMVKKTEMAKTGRVDLFSYYMSAHKIEGASEEMFIRRNKNPGCAYWNLVNPIPDTLSRIRRQVQNWPNRRVLIYIYSPSVATKLKIPCPYADPIGPIVRSSWSEGRFDPKLKEAIIRCKQQLKPLFEQHPNHFACRFYRRLYFDSKCERKPKPKIKKKPSLLREIRKARKAIEKAEYADRAKKRKLGEAKKRIRCYLDKAEKAFWVWYNWKQGKVSPEDFLKKYVPLVSFWSIGVFKLAGELCINSEKKFDPLLFHKKALPYLYKNRDSVNSRIWKVVRLEKDDVGKVVRLAQMDIYILEGYQGVAKRFTEGQQAESRYWKALWKWLQKQSKNPLSVYSCIEFKRSPWDWVAPGGAIG